MLVFVDESGDLGLKFDKGSSRFFTIALVVFRDAASAQACQRAIEDLRRELRLPERFEFHFHNDSRARRLAFLETVRRQGFSFYTFTLDKASEQFAALGLRQKESTYRWIVRMALESFEAALQDATVVIDGSSERLFRQELAAYLRRRMNEASTRIAKVRFSRSESDPLIQLADYVAGMTNRLSEQKTGASDYDALLRGKRRGHRLWP
jgi:Protein of unknown function (DUF3800)